MAFTGVAVIAKISDKKVRITGLSLGIGATGTIGLAANAASSEVDVTMPNWDAYDVPGTHGGNVTLNESVSVDVRCVDAAATTTEEIAVVKTGTVPADFLITLTNRDAALSGALEIDVSFGD